MKWYRKNHKKHWHKWFAWYPITITTNSNKTVKIWLETVWRKGTKFCVVTWDYDRIFYWVYEYEQYNTMEE